MYNTTFYLTIDINEVTHRETYEIWDIEQLDKDQLYFQINSFIGYTLRKFSPCKYNDIKEFGITTTRRFDKSIDISKLVDGTTNSIYCKNNSNGTKFDIDIKDILDTHLHHVKCDLENCKQIAMKLFDCGILKVTTNIEEGVDYV